MDKVLQKPDTGFSVAYSIDDSFDSESFIKLRLRVCHDGLSPNNTYFDKEVMEEAKDTIKNKPILAHVKYDADGKPILGSHDYHIEEHRLKDGEYKIIYDEIPIGVIPEDCNFTIEEYDDRNYVFVDAFVWRDYSNYCEELIENAVNTKLSMEISIPDDSIVYNCKENYWEISKFKFRGISLLNENLGTGMHKALATTENFSANEAESIVRERMIILMEALQDCLQNYNKENLSKGGNDLDKFKELLQKYNVTAEEITFEIDGLSDEELEIKFAETYESENLDDSTNEEQDNSDDVSEDVQNEDFEKNDDEDTPNEQTDTFVKSFELSHSDIQYGLYKLLEAYELADDEWYYIQEVYDTYFVYRGRKIYKQAYIKDGDNVSLDGERTELFEELLTASEKAELELMRSNYSTLQDFKAKYEQAQKEEILNSEKYSVLSENKDFVELKANAEKYSIDEIERECKVIFADHVLSVGEFSLHEDSKANRLNIPMNQQEENKPYGGHFDKYIKKAKN